MESVKGLLNIGGLLMTIPTAWCFIEVFRQGSYILTLKNHVLSHEEEKAQPSDSINEETLYN